MRQDHERLPAFPAIAGTLAFSVVAWIAAAIAFAHIWSRP